MWHHLFITLVTVIFSVFNFSLIKTMLLINQLNVTYPNLLLKRLTGCAEIRLLAEAEFWWLHAAKG